MAMQCEGFVFTAEFDSGNLAKVEAVTKPDNKGPESGVDGVDYEFNLWPRADCAGTEFENGNRTWFYFGMKGGSPLKVVKLNIVNLNRQVKMFSQGMTPVFKSHSTRNQWERIREKPTFGYDGSVFVVSFKHRLTDTKSFTYFAFTYPFSYSELQTSLSNIDSRMSTSPPTEPNSDDIYYCRECVCYSLEGRRVDLLTISSHQGKSDSCEPRLPHLFPEEKCRAKKFPDKKVIFLSARVHPGETPSSFVMNGVINFLLLKEDPIAQLLRKLYVFKIIPMLNPDGVARGHYRTDTRGVNLNRYYTNPSHIYHPSVFAARSLILYHHYGSEDALEENQMPVIENKVSDLSISKLSPPSSSPDLVTTINPSKLSPINDLGSIPVSQCKTPVIDCEDTSSGSDKSSSSDNSTDTHKSFNKEKSGLFLYIDFHGHASKKGIFMYGNHFQNAAEKVECMLLPKILSINSPHFHFHSCNFTERIMYLRDRRDGLSREGAGRVTVHKITGLVRSYTLECNYNTGRIMNVVPPSIRDTNKRSPITTLVPPKYTPAIFEEVGRSLAISILDMTNSNPYSRVVNSEYHSINGVKDWIKKVIAHEESTAIFKMKAARKGRLDSQIKRKTKSDLPKSTSNAKIVERKENLIGLPKISSKVTKKKLKKSASANVLQVRSKSLAVNNLACCSKSLSLPPKPKTIDSIVIKKGPKRIKISGEVDSKWSKPTTSKSDDSSSVAIPSWKSMARLEKKILDPKRRKKQKPKPK